MPNLILYLIKYSLLATGPKTFSRHQMKRKNVWNENPIIVKVHKPNVGELNEVPREELQREVPLQIDLNMIIRSYGSH